MTYGPNDAADDVEALKPGDLIEHNGVSEVSWTENVKVDGEDVVRCHLADGSILDTGQGQNFRVLNYWTE